MAASTNKHTITIIPQIDSNTFPCKCFSPIFNSMIHRIYANQMFNIFHFCPLVMIWCVRLAAKCTLFVWWISVFVIFWIIIHCHLAKIMIVISMQTLNFKSNIRILIPWYVLCPSIFGHNSRYCRCPALTPPNPLQSTTFQMGISLFPQLKINHYWYFKINIYIYRNIKCSLRKILILHFESLLSNEMRTRLVEMINNLWTVIKYWNWFDAVWQVFWMHLIFHIYCQY